MAFQYRQCLITITILSLSAERPEKPIMSSFQFDRPPNIFYLRPGRRLLELECTATKPTNDIIYWAATTTLKFRNLYHLWDTVEESELNPKIAQHKIPGGDGAVRSTYKVNLTTRLNSTYVACFSYSPLRHAHMCTETPKGRCNRTALIIVIEGPKERPTLVVDYPGYPGEVSHGDPIRARCASGVPLNHTLVFIFFFDQEVHAVYPGDQRIIEHNVIDHTAAHPIEMAIVQFRTKPTMTTVSVACFSYDPVLNLGTEPLECLEDLDPFCTQVDVNVPVLEINATVPPATASPEEPAHPEDPEDPEDPDMDYRKWLTFPRLGFFAGTLALAVILGICYKAIAAVGEPDTKFGGTPGIGNADASPRVVVSDVAADGGGVADAAVAEGGVRGSGAAASTIAGSTLTGSTLTGSTFTTSTGATASTAVSRR